MPQERRLEQLNAALARVDLAYHLVLLDSTDSTSDVVKQSATQGVPEGLVVVADVQTKGRGRQGRTWLSPAGKGLYVSVLLRPAWPAGDSPFLGLAVGVAVAKALSGLGVPKIALKWPNDVFAGPRKIAGILIEPRISRNEIEFAVVGIGVNIAQGASDFASLPDVQATSCAMEKVPATCDDVLVRVLTELAAMYAQIKTGDRSCVMDEWTRFRLLNSK